MKALYGIVLLLITLIGCESREDRTMKKEDKLLKDLMIAGAISVAAKAPCSATVSETNSSSTNTIPASGTYRICGSEKLSGAQVRFAKSGKYRITAALGTQVLESSRCNSKSFSIDVALADPLGVKIAAAVSSNASFEHTSDSSGVYKITSNGPVNPSDYSCGTATPISRISEAYSLYFEPL